MNYYLNLHDNYKQLSLQFLQNQQRQGRIVSQQINRLNELTEFNSFIAMETLGAIEEGFSRVVAELCSINDSMFRVAQALEQPKMTRARELRNLGIDAFKNGWMDDAFDHLDQSLKEYKFDPLTHFYFALVQVEKNDYVGCQKSLHETIKYSTRLQEEMNWELMRIRCRAALMLENQLRSQNKIEEADKIVIDSIGFWRPLDFLVRPFAILPRNGEELNGRGLIYSLKNERLFIYLESKYYNYQEPLALFLKKTLITKSIEDIACCLGSSPELATPLQSLGISQELIEEASAFLYRNHFHRMFQLCNEGLTPFAATRVSAIRKGKVFPTNLEEFAKAKQQLWNGYEFVNLPEGPEKLLSAISFFENKVSEAIALAKTKGYKGVSFRILHGIPRGERIARHWLSRKFDEEPLSEEWSDEIKSMITRCRNIYPRPTYWLSK